jgi:hypothetical protein
MKKLIPVIIIIAAIIGGTVAYRMYNKPHRDIASEDAAFSLTADALFDAFEEDEAAANALYLDKVVEVTGDVAEVTDNSAGQAVIIITAANAMLGGVSATMQETGIVNISEGETVTVKCRCTGFLMDVILVNCSLK